ncbi:hypothetical protein M2322_003438 [Rhodoblastus acidophilus]|uniref:hypothetical protein n=1 Tax=Rhodoblastus acidophilus TaxID=1074 RepID=UPI00222596D1|nr:hypothetical protein [Rhodoblastus acidophilus]MCW2317873.1 hypothetical protein [Rhodoblastus acidophilus]
MRESFSLYFASALVLVALQASNPAQAADLPSTKGELVAPSAASCDFFQNQLIGSFCEDTFGGGAAFAHEQLRIASPAYAHGGSFHGGSSVSSDRWRRDWVDVTGSAYWAPTAWLRLSVSSEHNNYSAMSVQGPHMAATSTRLSNASWQTAAATFRLFDYRVDGLRIFSGATASLGGLPAATGVPGDGMMQAALYAGAHWRLGASDYSLNPYGALSLAHYNSPQRSEFASTVRLLLAQDVWGVAAGPAVTTAAYNYHGGANGQGFPAQQYFAGAHVALQPFRVTGTPVLKDAVVNFEALHSLGRAGFAYYVNPNADEMIYRASFQFNFGS